MGIKGTWKRKVHEKKSRQRGKAKKTCLMLLSAVLWLAAGDVTVQAAPAVLDAPSAEVYEQASEGSSVVGNLIQDSTFDYQGDVTAEDGSVWHRIITANGVTGYIRGDIALRTGEEQPTEPEENTPEAGQEAENTPEAGAENAEGQEAENTPEAAPEEEAAEREETGNAPEGTAETGAEEEEAGEEGTDGITAEGMTPLSGNGAGREKTYATEGVGNRLRQKSGLTEETEEAGEPESGNHGFDIVPLIAAFVFLASLLGAGFFHGKMKQEAMWLEDAPGSGAGRWRGAKGQKRKRKSRQKKKKKRKQRTGKEHGKKQRAAEGGKSGYGQSRKE